jgi:hypothetical protein
VIEEIIGTSAQMMTYEEPKIRCVRLERSTIGELGFERNGDLASFGAAIHVRTSPNRAYGCSINSLILDAMIES